MIADELRRIADEIAKWAWYEGPIGSTADDIATELRGIAHQIDTTATP